MGYRRLFVVVGTGLLAQLIGLLPLAPLLTAPQSILPEPGQSLVDLRDPQTIRRAAEQGTSRAQYNLGVMYDEGRGVARDVSKAVAGAGRL